LLRVSAGGARTVSGRGRLPPRCSTVLLAQSEPSSGSGVESLRACPHSHWPSAPLSRLSSPRCPGFGELASPWHGDKRRGVLRSFARTSASSLRTMGTQFARTTPRLGCSRSFLMSPLARPSCRRRSRGSRCTWPTMATGHPLDRTWSPVNWPAGGGETNEYRLHHPTTGSSRDDTGPRLRVVTRVKG
jgi:hypothetical protein